MFDSDSFLLKSDALDDKRPAIQIMNFPKVCPSQRDQVKVNQQTSSSSTLSISQRPTQPANDDDIPPMEASGNLYQSEPGLIQFSQVDLGDKPEDESQYTSYSDGSRHIADELEPTFLQAHNRDLLEQSKFPQIWEDLHFLIYRFHWLDNTITEIDRLEQKDEKNMIVIKYFLTKALIILTQEFVANIRVTENISKYDQWNQFLVETKQLKKVTRDLNEQLYEKIDRLEELYHQMQIQNDSDTDLYQMTQKYITKDVIENDFNSIKIGFRIALKYLYQVSQDKINNINTQNIEYYARLQFLLIVSMLINNIFTNQRETCFDVIKDQIKIKKLISPTQIEKFLKCATVVNLINQTKQLYDIYFAKK